MMRLLHLPILIWLLVASPSRASDDESLARILAASAKGNPLRPDLQRPLDDRLALLETKGIEECGLFNGVVHLVHTPKEVRALSGKLNPGDQLVLAGGEWTDAQLSFAGQGTQQAPILIRPQNSGGAVFTGLSEVTFHGEHLIISGLTMRGVQVKKSGSVLFRLGNGAGHPANHCIVDHLTIEGCNSPQAEDWPRLRMFDVVLSGQDDTIANSTFADMKHYGQMIAAQDLPREGLQHLHLLNNRFINRPKIDNQNGYEIIQIGWSGEKAGSAGSLIQGNLFEDCDGEDELVTLKASDVFVRHNTVNACQGALCLREANRVLVQGNVFDGKDKPNTGGVRLCGAGHVIIENTFRHLRKPANYYFWPLSMMAASAEACRDDVEGYGRAKNVLIAKNRFEANDHRIAAGIYPRPQYSLLPQNIEIRDNLFIGTPDTGAVEFAAPDPTGELGRNIVETDNQFQP